MLQQTQVGRVIPKYREFLKRFPTARALAEAELRDVLTLWQGLGYNRRAKALHDCARIVQSTHGGRFPRTESELRALPGVGVYTARAVCAFAYNMPVVLLETNIRTVFLHHLLGHRQSVPDSELMELGGKLLDTARPREWQWALMDYGAHLKAHGIRLNTMSKHYTKQSTFKGSDREVRGALIRHLTQHACVHEGALLTALPFPRVRIQKQLTSLARDGLVHKRGGVWSL